MQTKQRRAPRGRPKHQRTLSFWCTEAMHTFAMQKGGSAYMRAVFEKEMKRFGEKR